MLSVHVPATCSLRSNIICPAPFLFGILWTYRNQLPVPPDSPFDACAFMPRNIRPVSGGGRHIMNDYVFVRKEYENGTIYSTE